MTPNFKAFLATLLFIAAGATLGFLFAAALTKHQHPDPTQSWDQENLKRYDKGCPTAVYIAPGGNLVECQYTTTKAEPAAEPVYNTFKTIDEAALDVSARIYKYSRYYEFGGVIVRTPKGYVLSKPVTQHHGTDVEFSEDPETYPFPIVATYHVHPCLANVIPSVFSPQDLSGSRTNHTPAYVLDECTGALHYWAPGDGYITDGKTLLELGVSPVQIIEGVKLSAGKIVGSIAVDGVVIN